MTAMVMPAAMTAAPTPAIIGESLRCPFETTFCILAPNFSKTLATDCVVMCDLTHLTEFRGSRLWFRGNPFDKPAVDVMRGTQCVETDARKCCRLGWHGKP
jgi:hypothetical protein